MVTTINQPLHQVAQLRKTMTRGFHSSAVGTPTSSECRNSAARSWPNGESIIRVDHKSYGYGYDDSSIIWYGPLIDQL